ncbi:hypothetical protein B566_EDAN003724 [Ephemera danica]|nr:hypothetical protein B566_EDAN003724 [Ephemera danica]
MANSVSSYAVTKSAAFYILATLLLVLGEFCCCFGHFARQRRVFTFISGIIFIISGLLVLIGLVMYISVFKAEIGSKLRPRSSLQPPLFTYRYGFSFVLVVSGFMSTEVAGTCAIFLYIYWHQLDWTHKSSTNLLLAVPPPPHLATVQPCRRHYHYRGPVQPLRRYSYGSGTSPPPPPPPALTRCGHYATMPRSHPPQVRLPGDDQCHQQESTAMGLRSHSQGTLADRHMRDSYYGGCQQGIPRDLTCNTVSTTADVACSPHEFVTFPDVGFQQQFGHERTREYSYETLRKTTPV